VSDARGRFTAVTRSLTAGATAGILPGDEAVYIGTVRLVRDEKNDLSAILVRDDHQWADDKYKARFGTRTSLCKAHVILTVNALTR
jgi:hypothetical protein